MINRICRLDKYLMLVRRFINVSFRLMIQNDWDLKTCQEYNTILTHEGGPLCPTDGRVPVGLVFHIADVYLEELEKDVRSLEKDASKPVPLATLLSPFLDLAARTPLITTYKHLQSSLFEPLLSSCSPPATNSDVENEPRAPKRRRVDNSSLDSYSYILSNACLDDPSVEIKLSSNVLHKKLLRRIFDVASQAETRDANRRKMYALWKAEKDEDDDGDEET